MLVYYTFLKHLLILISNDRSLHFKPFMITGNAVSHYFILSFTLLVIWVIALLRTNSFNIFSWKLIVSPYFSNQFLFYILTFLCIFLSEYNFSLHSLFVAIFFLYLSFLCFKDKKGYSFLQIRELLKLQLFLNFYCSYVLILTFFDPIVCIVVDAGIFKCFGVSSMLTIAYNL